MITQQSILSNIQNDINDLGMSLIQPGEYLDFFNTALQEISQECKVYLGRYIFVPNPDANNPININYVVIPQFDANGNRLSPLKFERILRQDSELTKYIETREYSIQSISSTYSNNLSFRGISKSISRGGFATQFANPDNNNQIDGSITIIFTKNFEIGEQVVIDFIQSVPFLITKWTNNPQFQIPDYMKNSLQNLILSYVCKRLYMEGKEEYGNRFRIASEEAEKYIKKLNAYTRTLRDEQSPLQAMPLNFLPEREDYY
jgi:hypothetical protein